MYFMSFFKGDLYPAVGWKRLQMMMHFKDGTYFKLFDASLTVITKKLICTSTAVDLVDRL